MEKKIKILLTILIIILIIPFLQIPVDYMKLKTQITPFLLEDFNADEEYQFRALEWGWSAEQAAKWMPIQKDESVELDADDLVYYHSKREYTLDGKSAVITFEFREEQLDAVSLDFQLNGDEKYWFYDQVEALTELYGEPSESFDHTSGLLQGEGYRWGSRENSLQIQLLIKSDETMLVTLGSVKMLDKYWQQD